MSRQSYENHRKLLAGWGITDHRPTTAADALAGIVGGLEIVGGAGVEEEAARAQAPTPAAPCYDLAAVAPRGNVVSVAGGSSPVKVPGGIVAPKVSARDLFDVRDRPWTDSAGRTFEAGGADHRTAGMLAAASYAAYCNLAIVDIGAEEHPERASRPVTLWHAIMREGGAATVLHWFRDADPREWAAQFTHGDPHTCAGYILWALHEHEFYAQDGTPRAVLLGV